MIRQTFRPLLVWCAALASAGDAAGAAAVADGGAPALTVKVANPLPDARKSETVVLHLGDLHRVAPSLEPAKTVIADSPINSNVPVSVALRSTR